MIENEPYGAEPWRLTETSLDPDLIAQSESVFALSNGHIGLRGNLDEGDPHGLPGTYLNSLYEDRPLPYAEAGYGFPDMGQTVINVTNGKIIRLLVNDEPFDIRYGIVRSHTRILDMRAGTLTREVVWTSPAGHTVKVKSVRLVSLTQRAIAAISYSVTPVTFPDGRQRGRARRLPGRRAAARRRAVRDRGERGDPHRGRRPARRCDARGAAGQRGAQRHRRRPPARGPGARHPVEQAAAGRRDGPRRHRAAEDVAPRGVLPRPWAAYRRRRGAAGRGTAAGQVPRLRLVERSGPGPRSSTRCRAPWPPPS